MKKPDAGIPLLELRRAGKDFATNRDLAIRIASWFGAAPQAEVVQAVDDVTLSIAPGEVVGLVGESGCGKSTLGRMAAGLHQLSRGTRLWKGRPVEQLPAADKRRIQLGIQMIFQDPTAALNPRMRVKDIIGEAPVVHGMVGSAGQREYVRDLMHQVGLDPAGMRRFPHQFSGGQRARIGIARALAVRPELLVCDEAVAALDVSIQAQVLNLFIRLRDELDLTYLFISHDLGVVRHIADRIVVMYLGRIVESAAAEDLFARPNHPYTVSLLAAAPSIDARPVRFATVGGELPSPLHPPAGCHFHPRCPHAMERCKQDKPELRQIGPEHFSACHLNDAT